MSLYITKEEEELALQRKRKPSEPFNEPRLEAFCAMMGAGTGTVDQIFCDVFKPPVDASRRLVKLTARQLSMKKAISTRIGYFRKHFLDNLKDSLLIDKYEVIDIISNRIRDDKTHSRDIVPLANKLSELLGWEDEVETNEDPITKLLAKVKETRALPSERRRRIAE